MIAVTEKPREAQATESRLRRLLAPRQEPGFDRFDALVMAMYSAILAFAIHYYQPFCDEAQAWLLARLLAAGVAVSAFAL